ncbi:effector-associated constant component EACC1 [Amycolatopsis sp. NBC_00438]
MINTVVANGLALSSLVVAVAGWRTQRKPLPPTVTLEPPSHSR